MVTIAPWEKLASTLRISNVLFAITFLLIFVAEALHRTIHLGSSPSASFLAVSVGNPFFANLCLLALAAFFLLRPGKGLAAAALGVGAAAEVYLNGLRPPGSLSLFSLGVGLGGSGLLGQAYLASTRPDSRKQILQLMGYCLALPLSLVFGTWQLSATPQNTGGIVYDLYLYAADASFGQQWSFTANHWIRSSASLEAIIHWIYEFPGFLIPLAQVLKLIYPERLYVDPTLAFYTVGAIGGGCYSLCPAVGPDYFFAAVFPDTPPAVVPPHPVFWQNYVAPRNQMPSLHIGWALTIWWLLRCVNRRWGAFGLAFLAVTHVAAFIGTHYIVDYVGAYPVAACVFSLVALLQNRRFPGLALSSAVILCGLGFLIGVKILIGFPFFWFNNPPVVIVSCGLLVALSLLTTYGLHREFRKQALTL